MAYRFVNEFPAARKPIVPVSNFARPLRGVFTMHDARPGGAARESRFRRSGDSRVTQSLVALHGDEVASEVDRYVREPVLVCMSISAGFLEVVEDADYPRGVWQDAQGASCMLSLTERDVSVGLRNWC